MLRATLRNVFAHKVRLLLTGLSVVLGVGFLAGTLVFTDTLKATFNDLIGRTSTNLSVVVRANSDFSATDIGASSDRALVPNSLAANVAAVPGVKQAIGEVQGIDLLVTAAGKAVQPKSPGPPTLAVSWTPANFGSLAFVQGAGPTGPGQVAIDQSAADSYHLHVGDHVTVQTQGSPIQATIVGIVTVGGSSNLAGAVLSVFDPVTAAQVAGKPGFANQIDVQAEGGVSQQALAARIGPTLPKGFEAVTAKAVNKEQSDSISKALGFFNVFLLIFAGVALFVGLFIILNTFTMLVAQRTRELALLRAIGASRRQVMSAVLGEAAVVGVVASTVGLVLGLLVALGVRALLDAVGVSMPAGSLVIKTHTIVASYVVGVLVTLLAAWFPSFRASRIPPIAAMRDGVALPERSLRVRAVIGGVLTLIGAVSIAGSIRGSSGGAAARVGVGILFVMIGIWVMSALISRPVVRFIGAPLVKIFGLPARLGRSNAVRNPRRTAATSASVMIGLALVTMLTVLAASTKSSITSVVNNNLGADYVLTSQSFLGFSPDVAAKATATPGVATVGETRVGAARLNGKTVVVAAVSQNIGSVIKVHMQAGSLDALGKNELLVSQTKAKSSNVVVGQVLSVEYPTGGTQHITIGGIFKDNSLLGNGGADYLIGLPTYAKNYTTQLDAIVYVLAEPGQRQAAGAALETSLKAYPQVKIQGQSAYKDSITKQIDQFVNLIFGLLAVALIIAVLGIVNTLALSVYERTREIGLLRAVGMSRAQLREMIWLESAVIAVFGALLGLVLGVIFGWAVVSTSGGQLNHVVYPIASFIGFVIGAGIVGVLAALWPAWRASRRPVLAAIATE
ncbi:MAG TPA: FtsX-like permease family protein [Acidothermaceae bacterium]|jgi:putative ABC transport system permease protein